MGHGRTADAMDRSFHYHDMAEDTIELMADDAPVAVADDGGALDLELARVMIAREDSCPPVVGGDV